MALLIASLALLPLWLLRAIATVLSYLVYWCYRGKGLAKNITINLAIANPGLNDKALGVLVQQVLKNELWSMVESFYHWASANRHALQQIDQVHNSQLLHSALAAQKGLLLVVPHMGTWEVMNAWISAQCQPTIMYKPAGNKAINALMLRARQATNATLVSTDATGVSQLYKNLKQGGVSIVLPDHVPEKPGGVEVPFFGLLTPTTTLVSKLAGKLQCPVLSLCCIRNSAGRYDIYCQQVDTAIYNADVAVSATALSQHVQAMCQQFMPHYIWSYKRFKRNSQFNGLYNLPLAQALAQVRALQVT